MSYKRLSRTLLEVLQRNGTISPQAIGRGQSLTKNPISKNSRSSLASEQRFVQQGEIATLSTLMVDTKQVQEINAMQRVTTR
jgi:hypothetical protein